ncbi:hypothetical protein [Reyranella sp.]|uniref:hypothetical protein n=1 Tax=Reyranella sp. TaxID=1929291 RepID=UPI003BACDFC0
MTTNECQRRTHPAVTIDAVAAGRTPCGGTKRWVPDATVFLSSFQALGERP